MYIYVSFRDYLLHQPVVVVFFFCVLTGGIMKYMIGSFVITVSVAMYTQDVILGALAYGVLLTLNGILEELFCED